jgi:hypothetical protein
VPAGTWCDEYEQRNLYGKRITVTFANILLARKNFKFFGKTSRKVLASEKSCATIKKSGSLMLC